MHTPPAFEAVAPTVRSGGVPVCEACGSVVKPDITFFGEMLPDGALEAALQPGRTRIVWIETPANPTWDVTDIAAAAQTLKGKKVARGTRMLVFPASGRIFQEAPVSIWEEDLSEVWKAVEELRARVRIETFL